MDEPSGLQREYLHRGKVPGALASLRMTWFSSDHCNLGNENLSNENLGLPDLRHAGCGRRIATALCGDDAIDDDHPDAGQVTRMDTLQQVSAGGVLCLVHHCEGRVTARRDQPASQVADPGGISGGEADGYLSRNVSQRR